MNKAFIKDMFERAVRTFAQSLLAYFGAGAFDLFHADWKQAASVSVGALILSILTSLAAGKAVGQPTSASLLPEQGAVAPTPVVPTQGPVN